MDSAVQSLGAGEIVAKGLFDDQPRERSASATTIEPGLSQALGDNRKQAWRRGHIEQAIATGSTLLVHGNQIAGQLLVGRGIVEPAGAIGDAGGKALPYL